MIAYGDSPLTHVEALLRSDLEELHDHLYDLRVEIGERLADESVGGAAYSRGVIRDFHRALQTTAEGVLSLRRIHAELRAAGATVSATTDPDAFADAFLQLAAAQLELGVHDLEDVLLGAIEVGRDRKNGPGEVHA